MLYLVRYRLSQFIKLLMYSLYKYIHITSKFIIKLDIYNSYIWETDHLVTSEMHFDIIYIPLKALFLHYFGDT